MQFEIGNRSWEKRSSHGRKPIFKTPDDLWNACVEYFNWIVETPLYKVEAFAYQGAVTQEPLPLMRAMTMEGLCLFLDIGTSTWADYRNRTDFSEVVAKVEQVMRDQKFGGAAAGLLNANIIARDLGLKDQTDNKHTITDLSEAELDRRIEQLERQLKG